MGRTGGSGLRLILYSHDSLVGLCAVARMNLFVTLIRARQIGFVSVCVR